MIAGEIEIRLLADIARLQRDMDRANRVVGNATAAIATAARVAGAALASMAGGISLQQLASITDQYTKFTSQLKLATTSQQEYARALEDVKRISNTAQNDMQATGVLYARIIASTKALGVSQSQVAKVTETINLALAAGAAGASEASSAMLQLSQAFGSGVLRGEEFNAVYEAAPELLRVLASSMGIPIGALRKLAEEGKLTSDVLVKAFTDDAVIERLRSNVAQITTFSGALTVLRNNLVEIIGVQAQTSGIVSAVTKGILTLADSVGTLVNGLYTAGKIAAAYFLAVKVAPVAFHMAAAATWKLIGATATYAMNVAIGQANTIKLNAALWGTSVSAQMAAGSLTKAALAGNVLFAAFAGWHLGKFFEDEFTQVKVFAELLTGAVLELWEDIKLSAALAADAVTLGWRKAFEWLTASLVPMYEGIAAGLRKIGFDEKAGQIDDFAKRVRAAGESQGTFTSRTAEARAEHERNVGAIRQVTVAHVGAIFATAKLTEGAKAASTAVAGAAKEMSKEQKQALKTAADFIASQQRELEAIGKTEDQQRMLNAARAAVAAPLEAQRKAIMANALALTVEKQAYEASEASKKAAVEFEKNYAEAVGMTAGILADRVKDAETEAARNEDLARTYGMTKAAIEAEELARLENQLAQRSTLGLTLDEIDALEKLIAAKKRSAAALFSTEMQDANKKAADSAASEWARVADSLTDNIMRGGKSAAEYLKDLFRTLVLRPIIQPVGNAIGGAVTSALGLPGLAQAAGTVGSSGGLLSGLAGASGAFGSGLMSGLSAWGAEGSVTGLLGSGALFGGGIANGLGAIAGALGPIALGVGAVVSLANKAFGMGPKEITGTSLSGTFGAAGFSGTTDSAWKKEGGWFRSDKTGVDKVAVDAAAAKQFTAAYDAIKAASADYASVLGINADAIKDRAQSLSIALTKDEAANQKAIADFFVNVGNTIAGELLPSLSKFQQEGEQASATLQRLATGYALVDTALTSIGMSFGAVGTASLEARERLLAAAGGLEAFAANTAGFQQNFLTEAERNAPVLKSVTEQLAAMGLSAIDTRDEFKAVVLGLDLTTEAGAAQYGSLMKLQTAFAQVYPAIDQTAIAAERAAKVLQERNTLQEQLDALTLTEVQQLERQRGALDESNRALFDQIQAVKAQKTAAEQAAVAQQEAAAAIKAAQESAAASIRSLGDAFMGAFERAKDAAQALRDFNDSLKLGNLSTLDPDARYREAKKQFQAAGVNDTQAMQAFLQASKDRGADDFYYQRDFAAVQEKLASGIAQADRTAAAMPGLYQAMSGWLSPSLPTFTAPSAPPVVQTGSMSRSSAQQGDLTRVEAKVDRLIEKLGGTMEVVASSTSALAEQFDRVSRGGQRLSTEAG